MGYLLAKLTKTAKSAKGIRDRAYYGDPATLPIGLPLIYSLQQHLAQRAGPHYDLRIGNEKGLHSWAVPKGLPEPGGRHLAIHQPMHSPRYKDFEGEIPLGQYGGGTVKLADYGKVVVHRAGRGIIEFSVAHKKRPETYVLKRLNANKEWLLVNTTPTESRAHKVHKKVHYRVIPEDKLDEVLQGDVMVGKKIDGAAALAELAKNRMNIYSYRLDTKGNPIVHTHKLDLPPELPIPKDLQGSIIRGELYGTKNGKAIPPQELGGILNSSLANALETRRRRGIQLQLAMFDMLGTDLPRKERIKHLERLAESLKKVKAPVGMAPYTTDKAKALEWLKTIKAGKDPLTREGLVISPLDYGKPAKLKFRPESDVVVRNIFKADTKSGKPRAGGFEYSLPGSDKVVGKVGTGFNRATLMDMLANPDKYIGRTARIRAQEQFPSGAYRAPSFIALHEG